MRFQVLTSALMISLFWNVKPLQWCTNDSVSEERFASIFVAV